MEETKFQNQDEKPHVGKMSSTILSRRQFIRRITSLGLGAAAIGSVLSLLSCEQSNAPGPLEPIPSSSGPLSNKAPSAIASRLAVARGGDPSALVRAVLKPLGGIEQFVKPGNDVIIKPNICVAYHPPEYAATTNPEVVAALVSLSLEAGAKRVRVMDSPFGGTPEQAYDRSGIEQAVREAGGEMEIMSPIKFKMTEIPEGRDIKSWPVYADVLDADVLINVPIAKHHSLGRLTLGMKNLMGVITRRNEFHFNLGQRLADLTSLLRPELTVIDAVRILTNHGPTGGDLNDVKTLNTIIASTDIIAADSYAATLFGLTGADIPAIREGAVMGLGTMDLEKVEIEEAEI